jgi:hypothetical protein
VVGGARSGFASRFGVLWLLGTRVAGVSRLGQDEGELERTACYLCVGLGVWSGNGVGVW